MAGVLVAGCGFGVEERHYAGVPQGVELFGSADGREFDGPHIAWSDKPALLYVILMGSSSCPNLVVTIDWLDDATVEMTTDSDSRGTCTADIAPTTSEIDLSDRYQGVSLRVVLIPRDYPSEASTIELPSQP